jgi:1-acyl-sn-glycerol-3-phosphate acyltransferase
MVNKNRWCFHYWIFYYILRCIYRLFFRWEIHGLEHFPPSGGFILAVNHASYLDPTIVGSAAPRKLFYMARKTLFKKGFWERFLLSINAIPIDREGYDLHAIKNMIDIIHAGEPVLIFPEGTRSPDGNLQQIRHGIGFVTMRAHADVLPCYISGSWYILPKGEKVIRFHKVKVLFGKMISYSQFGDLHPTKVNYQKISNIVMEQIAGLKAQLEGEKRQKKEK